MANDILSHQAFQNPDATNDRLKQRMFRRTMVGLGAGLVAVTSFFPALHAGEKKFDQLRRDGAPLAVPTDTSHANVYVVSDEDTSLRKIAEHFSGGSQDALVGLIDTEAMEYNLKTYGPKDKNNANVYPGENLLVPDQYHRNLPTPNQSK